jgi:hypothetical protein
MHSIDEIAKRLEKLEKAVFGNGTKATKTPKADGNFKGIAGGVRFLQTKSFFAKKRTAVEVKTELEQHGYHYQIAAVQTTLNRASVKNGPLTAFRENGVKVYVTRK